MKKESLLWRSNTPWLALLTITSLFFIFITWLTDPDAFSSIILTILLFTAFIIFTGFWVEQRRRKKQLEILQSFLADPDEETEQRLMMVTDKFWHPGIRTVSEKLREQSQLVKEKQMELQNYQEFIEAWTHEIKTPLSLATLVLANRKAEIPPYVYQRMEHVRSAISSDVDKILYYARLQSDHMDYKFVKIDLNACVQECLEHFYAIIEEKKIDVQQTLMPLQVTSDKKVLIFILSQIFSNAFQYTPSDHGVVRILSWSGTQNEIHLAVRDNGKGVPPEDMPFLFDKGFTGNHPDRQNATGMGLYLLRKYAEVLSIDVVVEPISATGRGFGIELIFPEVMVT